MVTFVSMWVRVRLGAGTYPAILVPCMHTVMRGVYLVAGQAGRAGQGKSAACLALVSRAGGRLA